MNFSVQRRELNGYVNTNMKSNVVNGFIVQFEFWKNIQLVPPAII
jgi:hypothetical protein